MSNNSSQPFYFRMTMILLMMGLIVVLIIVAQDILVPLCFAMLLSLLLLPAVHFLEKKKFGRVLSILIALSVSLVIIGGIFYFFYAQITRFLEDMPAIRKQLNEHYHTVQLWIRERFNLGMREQEKIIDNATGALRDPENGFIGQTFFSITRLIFILFLLPVYAFLMLYYRDLLRRFMLELFDNHHRPRVQEVLNESKVIVYSYMLGLMIEMVIVAAINTTGFLILGIKYAILLGVLAAVLNLIPYVGMLIATIFCTLVTLSTTNSMGDVIWVAVILIVVQFIDNNIIMPRVVSSKVKVNALITIIGVLVGGAMAGVSGMFLSIPGIAILKAIFERVDGLKPWGMLLGDDITGLYTNKYVKRLMRIRSYKVDSVVPQPTSKAEDL